MIRIRQKKVKNGELEKNEQMSENKTKIMLLNEFVTINEYLGDKGRGRRNQRKQKKKRTSPRRLGMNPRVS